MIILRDDDVLLRSSGMPDAFERFKRVHEIACRSNKLIHVPSILTDDIQAFPGAIEYIQVELHAGRMRPQLHGKTHIDYGKLTKDEVVDQLFESTQWFRDTFGYFAEKWYTPWGANQPHLHEAGKELNLKVVDCSDVIKFKGRYGVTQHLSEGRPLSFFDGREIIMHWWDSLDVERLEFFVNKLNEAPTNN